MGPLPTTTTIGRTVENRGWGGLPPPPPPPPPGIILATNFSLSHPEASFFRAGRALRLRLPHHV
eukprot:4355094-Pyramimonas_sp.AAC.1